MKNIKIILSAVVFSGLIFSVYAIDNIDVIISKFRNQISLPGVEVKIPTVYELDISDLLNSSQYEIYNNTEKTFIPSLVMANSNIKTPVFNVVEAPGSSRSNQKLYNLTDNNYTTSSRFDVVEGQSNILKLNIQTGDTKIKTTHMYLSLDNNVAWPNYITIKYINSNNVEAIALNKTRYTDNLYFPVVNSSDFTVELEYSQPLVINEISFNDNTNLDSKKTLRFLAKPNNEYQLYFNPENYVNISKGEQPNLYDNKGIIRYNGTLTVKDNSTYKPIDSDADGVPDQMDNCTNTKNTDQKDLDGNGRGDACDDYDRDGVINSLDNCPNDPNAGQSDADSDKIGDVCDKEESRFTEKNSWVPWVGILLAVGAIGGLGFFVFRDLNNKKQ